MLNVKISCILPDSLGNIYGIYASLIFMVHLHCSMPTGLELEINVHSQEFFQYCVMSATAAGRGRNLTIINP